VYGRAALDGKAVLRSHVGRSMRSMLLLDVTGCTHLFGGTSSMLQDVARELHAKSYAVRCVVAPTAALARALSLALPAGAQPMLVAENELLAAVRALPIGALEVPGESIDFLLHLGFVRVGELLRLPRKQLLARFGMGLLNALDALVGERSSALAMLTDEQVWVREDNLLEPIRSVDLLLVAVEHMLAPLCKALEAEKKGVEELAVQFTLLDRRKKTLRISSAKATVEVRRLMRLLELKCAKESHNLFNVSAMDGGVERVAVKATRVGTLEQRQIALDHKEEQMSAKLPTLIDALSNRLSHDAVFQMLPVQSYIPERALTKSHDFSKLPDGLPGTEKPAHVGARPLHMFAAPEPIVALALLPDHAPVRFRWRSKMVSVVKADGPERIAPEWWREQVGGVAAAADETRDYFVVEDEHGMRYWIFRAEPTLEWFLHGVF